VTTAAPAGWYVDPSNPGLVRWWDGSQWTAHTSPAPHQQASPAATPPAPLIPMPGGQRAPRSRVSVLGATWLTLAGLWVALFVVAAALDRNHKIPGWIAEPVRLGLYALVGVGILWIVRWRQAKRQPPGSH